MDSNNRIKLHKRMKMQTNEWELMTASMSKSPITSDGGHGKW